MDGIQFSAQEFYQSVEQELAARKLPQMKSSRVEFHQGGTLSDKRIYLRLSRERFAFDVCAAPFGDSYFFSLRFVEVPRRGWLTLLLAAIALLLLWNQVEYMSRRSDDVYWWISCIVIGGIAARWALLKWGSRIPFFKTKQWEVLSGVMPDFDTFFLNLPLIGPIYERHRRDTYYRHDTRLLYQNIVTDVVKSKVDEVTAAKGVRLLRSHEYNPILTELYKPTAAKAVEQAA